MSTRTRWIAAALALTPFLADGQSRRLPMDPGEGAPLVRVWVEHARVFRFGEPVRVGFEVADDAHVVVGRVDSDGRLSILWPRTRRGTTLAKANTEYSVTGTNATTAFYATDRNASGYVFAIASYHPLDVTQFDASEFNYSQSMYRNAAYTPYYGSPRRVMERFASWIVYDEDTPWDYDVDYYAVDSPMFGNASAYCQYLRSGAAWHYGFTRSSMPYYCDSLAWGLQSCYWSSFTYSLNCFRPFRRGYPGSGVPVTPPPGKNGPTVFAPTHPDTVGRIDLPERRPPTRSDRSAGDAPEREGKFYAIPERAQRGGRGEDRSREPTSIARTANGRGPVDDDVRWVRSPRNPEARGSSPSPRGDRTYTGSRSSNNDYRDRGSRPSPRGETYSAPSRGGSSSRGDDSPRSTAPSRGSEGRPASAPVRTESPSSRQPSPSAGSSSGSSSSGRSEPARTESRPPSAPASSSGRGETRSGDTRRPPQQ
jgi:hypothetical protein